MNNFIQPGDVVTFTMPEAVTSGRCVKIGSLIVAATQDGANGARIPCQVTGVISHAKAASQAWTEGENVYWDNAAKNFTTVSTSNTLAGVAVEAVAGGAGDTTGIVRLNGSGAAA